MKAIYSVHMPLFIAVSGYLYWFSMQSHGSVQSALRRIRQLLPVCIVWGIALWLCIRKKRRLQVTGEALHYRFLVLVDVNDCGLRGILSGMCCPKKSFGENSYVLSSPRRSVLYNGSLLAERT